MNTKQIYKTMYQMKRSYENRFQPENMEYPLDMDYLHIMQKAYPKIWNLACVSWDAFNPYTRGEYSLVAIHYRYTNPYSGKGFYGHIFGAVEHFDLDCPENIVIRFNPNYFYSGITVSSVWRFKCTQCKIQYPEYFSHASKKFYCSNCFEEWLHE